MKGTQIIASRGRPSNNRSWPDPKPDEYGDEWSDGYKPGGTNYIGKSFYDHAAGYPVILDGVESSDALLEVVKSIGDMFEAFEARISESIDVAFGESAEFDHTLGKSVLAIGHGVHAMGERVDSLQYETAEMGKSLSFNVPGVGNVDYVNKGNFGEQGPSRAQILDALVKGVEAGHWGPQEVIKFESGSQPSDHVIKSLGL